MNRVPLEVVRQVADIYADIPPVACKGLCVASCCPVGDLMTPVEALRVTQKAGREPNGAAERDRREPCNMLSDEGKCTVYSVRPAICRLYGVDAGMQCPHGCKPSLPDGAGMEFVRRLRRIVHDAQNPV